MKRMVPAGPSTMLRTVPQSCALRCSDVPRTSCASCPRVREDWSQALAGFAAAEAELLRYEGWCSGRPFEEQERLEGGYDLRSDAMYAALRRLMAAPVPDARALAVKLDLAAAHELATLDGGEACLKAIRRDAWRMAGGGEP